MVAKLVSVARGDRGRAVEPRPAVPGARFVPTPQGSLQVTDGGPPDATPIVLLHCFACSLRWWDALLPFLEKHHRIVRIDLLGHGSSEKPARGYSMDDQATAVAAVLDGLPAGDRAIVVGHSLGFTVATALALRRPDLVSGLVNIGEWSRGDDVRLPLRVRLGRRSIFRRRLVPATEPATIRAQLRSVFAPGYDPAAGFDDPDQAVDDFRALSPAAFEQTDREARAYAATMSLPRRLDSIPIPLLAIFGSEDQCHRSPAKVAAAYSAVPGAVVETIAGAGHSPNVERPRETADLILAFATEAASRGRQS